MIFIIIGIFVLLIFIYGACKSSSNADNQTYETKEEPETLDDDVRMDEIMDQLTYDDEFVRKEDK